VDLGLLFDQLSRALSPSAVSVGSPRLPEWEGWLVLGFLLIIFATLVWWLYLSPVADGPGQTGHEPMSVGARHLLAGLVLLSGFSFVAGARWDELWHRMYGGFGDDFLWPPHLMIYGSLGLNSAFAGYGLATAARGSGGIRQRFRANPLVGLLGLVSAYQLASIPSDLIWHRIIGPDISAWSLPHFLLVVSTSAVIVIGLALVLAGTKHHGWVVGGWPGVLGLAVIAFLVVSTLALLQFGVTEWEWNDGVGIPFGRAIWVYPVVVLTIGIAESHLALFSLRRVGAATAVIAVSLAMQVAFVVYARGLLPPGPSLVSHLLLLLPAVALDLLYATRRSQVKWFRTLVEGVGLFAGVFILEAFLFLGRLMPYPSFGVGDAVLVVAIGGGAALGIAATARAIMTWLIQMDDEDRPSSVGHQRRFWRSVQLAR
jgi:hypothetical protein